MDITAFIVASRNSALLYGDYSTYHQQLSRRILKCRQKLGITTKPRAKYSKKPEVTAQDVQKDVGYLHLLLLTSERGWAQAMSIKTTHAAGSKGLNGRARSHIVSRLVKASRSAEHAATILADSGASPNDVLEARAYAALVAGAAAFEKQCWRPCLEAYAVARVIYGSLAARAPSAADLYRDLLSDTIDPSIRYAAYQLKTPRTVPIPAIAREHFLHADPALVDAVGQLDPAATDAADSASVAAEADAPKTLSWRSREVTIEDASIAEAWSAAAAAKTRLEQAFAIIVNATPRRLASAYDDILAATQEAADATKRAIDELREEGVSPSDHRIQSLQITRTAVNYEMISWRVGRNRVLAGAHDGAVEEREMRGARKAKKEGGQSEDKGEEEKEGGEEAANAAPDHALGLRDDKPRAKLVRLKEKVALYDGTLHNIDAVTELPGVAADEELAATLEATRAYFEALKCLAIGRSHAIVAKPANALALLDHAATILTRALPRLSAGATPTNPDGPATPLNITVSPVSALFLHTILRGEVQRHRGLVHVENLRARTRAAAAPLAPHQPPLIDRLDDLPDGGVELARIVKLPPVIAPVAAKPIFLDVAWNHIDYPRPDGGQDSSSSSSSSNGKKAADTVEAAVVAETGRAQPQKKGWFGFGR